VTRRRLRSRLSRSPTARRKWRPKMDKLLKAQATLPSRDLPLVGVASRSSTRRRGGASLKGSGRAALRVLTRAHRMHDPAAAPRVHGQATRGRRRRYVPLGFAWIAFGIAWALLGGFSLAGLGGLAFILIGLAWLAIGFAIAALRPISILT